MTTRVSVIIVSDYASGDAKGWEDLRQTLAALARQDWDGAVQYILAEAVEVASRIPEDFADLLPGLEALGFDVRSSYALKNAAAQAAEGELLAVLDGDCAPEPGWLRHLVATFDRFPDTAVVSGRTIYRSPSMKDRIIGLLSRAYLDRGGAGRTDAIANNNAGFRREALLAHPFLDDIGAFGGKLQAQAMREAGLAFRFEPAMLAVHAYEGWDMERDIRRNTGFATVMVRRIDPRIAHAWMARLGPAGMPLFFLARVYLSWSTLLRCRRHYDVPWRAVPGGLWLALRLHWLEIPGMRLAFAGDRIEQTAYR